MAIPSEVDVLIVGAGPVGLITSIGLNKQGVTTLIIEKREREEQVMYGRATTLYPRSLELLEQVTLTKSLIQEGFIARSSTNYLDGERVNKRGWNRMFQHFKLSMHDYALNIRQYRSEDVFRAHHAADGGSVWYGWALTSYKIDISLADGYNVSAVLEHATLGQKSIRTKYIVGSDGSSSTVRRLAGVSQDTDSTTYEWIRIDGKMSTDMPGADLGFASIETRSHGNILWVKLERDAYRIGFALTPVLLAKYPNGITKDQALVEAVEGMKPFKLTMNRVDWWTHYKIKQSVAQVLQKDDFILLAGDAAHTHSSAFAQGMNTGIHDATNLIWKLAGVCKGWYQAIVLQTYASERHAAAQKLIEIDRNAAAVISGDVPAEFRSRGKTPDELMALIFEENIGFNDGLGLSYGESILNCPARNTTVESGARAPDAILYEPGTHLPLRLYDALLSDGIVGRWSVIIFVGDPGSTSGSYLLATQCLSRLSSRNNEMVRFVTLIPNTTSSAWTALGTNTLGRFYLDLESEAHAEYGVDHMAGAMAVIRPDHILGFATNLDAGEEILDFFDNFVI